jgi:ATP-dependent protease ClpP protease subunit
MDNIYLWGDINEKKSRYIIKNLIDLSKSTDLINLLIFSDGGDLDSAIAIIDMIQALKNDGKIIRTITFKAYSSAVFIAASGSKTERLILHNASMMLHNVSVELSFDDKDKHQAFLAFQEIQIKKFYNLMIKLCGGSKIKKLLSDINKTDIWINADDAISFRLVDRKVSQWNEQ